jgi:signal transduction histidine kinase/CheY-like chemotaxis protein
MEQSILTVPLRNERDVVLARQRARELAASFRFDNQDQIRLATATSEMARNAYRYARDGKVIFCVQLDEPARLEISIHDNGSGISNLDDVYAGRYRSETGMGLGIIGSKKLMDSFEIRTGPNGTSVRMWKNIPPHAGLITPTAVKGIAQALKTKVPESPYEEIDRQNQELLNTLQELRTRQEELNLLNRELEDTNRGVVALYAELDERADYLRRASEIKSTFLSNVSHEFRTPLNSILSLAKLLLDRIDGDLTREQEKQIGFIASSAESLQELVNDLLDLAKVEAGKVRMRVKDFTAEELFSSLKGMLKPLLADNSSVELMFEDRSQQLALRTDEGKVSQILRNFISNAIKFTPRGRVTVSAELTDRQSILFSVADTGIGIAPEYFETIFKEFSQIDNPLQNKFRGTGLGLPLCRNLAALLGGSVWLESQLGAGSTFFAEIPTIYKGESEIPATEMPVLDFHRSAVLLIEDNHESFAVMESSLRKSEFQLIHADSIEHATAWLDRHRPEVVIADVHIGESTIWSFLRELQNSMPELPLIVISVYEEEQRALALGFKQFLKKPVSRDLLLRELRAVTSRQRPQKLLLVDDNEVSRYILRELLDRSWLELEEARSGSEAIRKVIETRPDAVILDLLMPDINGIDVLRTLRSNPDFQDTPVIIYTSKTLTDGERTELGSMASAIIRKDEVASRLSADWFLSRLAEVGIKEEA